MDRRPDRIVSHWETIAVTALPPGWRNVYTQSDDTETTSPCPAILLQEHRLDSHCWDIPRADGTMSLHFQDKPCEQPYETRAVFADFDGGNLEPVNDVGNYSRTVGPGEEMPDA